jgi:hypothetical protein
MTVFLPLLAPLLLLPPQRQQLRLLPPTSLSSCHRSFEFIINLSTMVLGTAEDASRYHTIMAAHKSSNTNFCGFLINQSTLDENITNLVYVRWS